MSFWQQRMSLASVQLIHLPRSWNGSGVRFGALFVAFAIWATPAHALFHWHERGSIRTREQVGRWQLEVVQSRFSGEVACRLMARNGYGFYEAGAVAFPVKRPIDANATAYRLDDGLVHWSRDDLPALIERGAPIDRGSMVDASEGLVWIPFEKLAATSRVWIAGRGTGTVSFFRLDGLRALHDLAPERGCVPDVRFVER